MSELLYIWDVYECDHEQFRLELVICVWILHDLVVAAEELYPPVREHLELLADALE